jgi:hypothetical protein
MDTKKVAALVLRQYNAEKELTGKADFRKLVSLHYQQFGYLLGMSSRDFFKQVSKECHEIQPPSSPKKHLISDKAFLLKDAAKRVADEYLLLGNGDSGLGKEFAEHYQFD